MTSKKDGNGLQWGEVVESYRRFRGPLAKVKTGALQWEEKRTKVSHKTGLAMRGP